MGGPPDLAGVKPFLNSILSDPFILGMPTIFRIPLSRLIVNLRLKKVISRYKLIGSGSPLTKWSDLFVKELRNELDQNDYTDVAIDYTFRYCPPTIEESLNKFKSAGIDEVILFPLFPHYTRAMTGSISALAQVQCKELRICLREIPSWGLDRDLIALQMSYLEVALNEAGPEARVLFVAHGIPLSEIQRGDRYKIEVEKTAKSLAERLPEGVECSLAYSSRLGPMKWLEPYLEDELKRLGGSPRPLIIMQLSFVFDCLETLYDLDIVAVKSAREMEIEKVIRVPSFNDDPRFVKIIAKIVREALDASA